MRSIGLERLFRKFGHGILEFQAMVEAGLRQADLSSNREF